MFRFFLNTKIPEQIPRHFLSIRSYHSRGTSPVYPCPSRKGAAQAKVGVFWDLHNKKPKGLPPYEIATRLMRAIYRFGLVRYRIAYANPTVYHKIPPIAPDGRMAEEVVKERENNGQGQVMLSEPQVCRVCGWKYFFYEQYLCHFKKHDFEYEKMVKRLDSTKGRRRVYLLGEYTLKMENYRRAVEEIWKSNSAPAEGYSLGHEITRAGFWVKKMRGWPWGADRELSVDVAELAERGQLECMVLVSRNPDLSWVLREAKRMGLKTVVVGDHHEGDLKKASDAWFSWMDVVRGKARSSGPKVVGKWRDKGILERLEWKYKPEVGGQEGVGEEAGLVGSEGAQPWWKLGSV